MIGPILPFLMILGQFGMGPGPGITAASTNACATAGYAHYRVVTIPAQVAMTADLSNYPVEVQGTYSYLATVANGGLVQNANGYDVVFFTDSTCSTKLNWQTEIYTAASGVVTYWVQVPTVSKTAAVTFVMAYDNAGISTDQSNATGTWDANFKAVYHFPNGATFTSNDSTGSFNATNANITAAAGQIDGAGSWNGNDSGSMSTVTTSSVITTAINNVTMSCWVNTNNNAKDGQMVFYNGSDSAGNGYGFAVNQEGVTNGHLFILYGGIAWYDSGTVVSGSAWHHLQMTVATGINGPGTLGTLFLDGAIIGTGHQFLSNAFSPAALSEIGYDNYPAHRHFTGTIDECRLSTALRNADWIKTDYNSQSSPATFYSVGSQF